MKCPPGEACLWSLRTHINSYTTISYIARLATSTASLLGARYHKKMLIVSRRIKPRSPHAQRHVIILKTQIPKLGSQIQSKRQNPESSNSINYKL